MLNGQISIILTFIIWFAPLAFGAVHLWPETILGLSIVYLFFLYLLKSAKTGAIEYRGNLLNLFFGLLVFYTLLQLCLKLTEYPYGTYMALRTAILYFLLFFVVTNTVQKRGQIDGIIFTVILTGFFVSMLGILQLMTGADKIYWAAESSNSNFFGTFMNENHFACYISMVALLTLGRLVANIYEARPITMALSLRQMLSATLDNVLNKNMLFTLFAFVIMVTGLFLSKSRAGISFFAIAVIFFILTVLAAKHQKKVTWFMLFVILAAFLLMNWVGMQRTVDELATIFSDLTYEGRVTIYTDALRMFSGHWFFGTGMGSFSDVFPLYRTGFENSVFYEHLHNDILQLCTEAGFLGFLLFLIPMAIFLIKLSVRANRSLSSYKYCVSAGILSSFVYLAMHSFVDFGMRVNAISSLFVILLALALLVMNLGRSKEYNEVEMKSKKIIALRTQKSRTFFVVFAGLVLLGASYAAIAPLAADIIVKNTKSPDLFNTAIALDPKNDGVYFKYCKFILLGVENGRIPKKDAYKKCGELIDKAIRLNPCKTDYLLVKGNLEFLRGDYGRASGFFEQAALAAPYNPDIQMSYSYSLYWQAINEKDPDRKKALLKKGSIYYDKGRIFGKNAELRSVVKSKAAYDLLKGELEKESVKIQ